MTRMWKYAIIFCFAPIAVSIAFAEGEQDQDLRTEQIELSLPWLSTISERFEDEGGPLMSRSGNLAEATFSQVHQCRERFRQMYGKFKVAEFLQFETVISRAHYAWSQSKFSIEEGYVMIDFHDDPEEYFFLLISSMIARLPDFDWPEELRKIRDEAFIKASLEMSSSDPATANTNEYFWPKLVICKFYEGDYPDTSIQLDLYEVDYDGTRRIE